MSSDRTAVDRECESVLELDGYKFRCDLTDLHGGDHVHEFMEMAGPPRRLHFAKLEWWHA